MMVSSRQMKLVTFEITAVIPHGVTDTRFITFTRQALMHHIANGPYGTPDEVLAKGLDMSTTTMKRVKV